MFIDNPRDHSAIHAVDKSKAISVVQIQEVKETLKAEKDEIGVELDQKISPLSIDKTKLTFKISGEIDQPLSITVPSLNAITHAESTFTINSELNLMKSEKLSLIHISEHTTLRRISNDVFSMKKK